MSEDQKAHPTGYSLTALPFDKLDDGAFEQFCADMLNLHPVVVCLRQGRVSDRRILAATRLLSGTVQKGADVRADAGLPEDPRRGARADAVDVGERDPQALVVREVDSSDSRQNLPPSISSAPRDRAATPVAACGAGCCR